MMTASQTTGADEHARRDEKCLLTPRDVAVFLGVPLRTIYRWRSYGKGPRGYRIGRHVRYRLEDVERWLERHRDTS